MSSPRIFVAIPALNELLYLPEVISSLRNQTYTNFIVYICVNQPDSWWGDVGKEEICIQNSKTIEYLSGIQDMSVVVIDRSSRGKAWKAKHYGVGMARKTLMDNIIQEANDMDIIVSMDADTTFGEKYFQSVISNFKSDPKNVALSVPYYHQLTGNEKADRAILRYEIYLRNYNINLIRIGCPYNFTAIGSAIALPVKSYKAIGGITPFKSGEDFYFLQKLRKYGAVGIWNSEKVFPASRFSDRVAFGTGPAMIKGREGDWSSYPVFHYSIFDRIREMYDLFPDLFNKDINTPMDVFLSATFKSDNIWQPLRENFKTEKQFIKACHTKIDGLRIFQFLKSEQKRINQTDEDNLNDFFDEFYSGLDIKNLGHPFGQEFFNTTKIEKMNEVRDFLVRVEEGMQGDIGI